MAATAEAEPVPLSAFVPRGLKAQLEQRARTHERSVSAELRLALRRHLADAGTAEHR